MPPLDEPDGCADKLKQLERENQRLHKKLRRAKHKIIKQKQKTRVASNMRFIRKSGA